MSLSRNFFERLPKLVTNYALREKCSTPIVEFFLDDGSHFEVKHIVEVGDSWVCYTIYDKTGCSTDFVSPFFSINRAVLYKDPQKSDSIGFRP